MAEEHTESSLEHAVRLNRERRVTQHAKAAREGVVWLVECRDLWDSPDEDQGVYFVPCALEAEVTVLAERFDDENPNDRILGIYRVWEPVVPQGPGLTRAQWLAGLR